MLYLKIDPTSLNRAGWRFDAGQKCWHKDGVGLKSKCPYDLTINFYAHEGEIQLMGLMDLPHKLERVS